MIEEILPNLFRIKIPLPKNPLGALNSYIIKDSRRNMIIDTGFAQDECKEAMRTGLEELGIDIQKTDFFITHMHPDHMGLALVIAPDTSKIYFNRIEADMLRSGFFLDEYTDFACQNGFPEKELQTLFNHPGFRSYKFAAKGLANFHIVNDGDIISISDYNFKCMQTPGHTRGHMCLYEADKKLLIAGDHILNDITATIQLWSDEQNPLRDYLTNLDKVYDLDIELTLPGHRSIITNCKERILELKDHHQKRLENIISILRNGDKNAFQIASQMSWDTNYESWDLFPGPQKWIATGEAIAHLKYLEEDKIQKERREKEAIYSLKKSKRIL
ncbi:MAG: MBL fold metallo-hydrolase [Proteobacteria bacterium]|nr:MBL fold metallo-hydrolase [Pseudomonadota bacterium]